METGKRSNTQIRVGRRVRTYPSTTREAWGTVVEDFGELPFHDVKVDHTRTVRAARRWAVQLDTGELVFVDNKHLTTD